MRLPHGTFGWVDGQSTDQPKSKAFYSELFGWEPKDQELPDGGHYTLFHKDGKMVAGLGQAQPGMPSLWLSYVMVEDVDAALGLVESNGGMVAMPAMDVMTAGRMAFAADNTGATIGLWQPRDHPGWELHGESGSVVWNELATKGVKDALPFYEKVLGWTWRAFEGGAVDYHYSQVDGIDNAGALELPEGWDVPPHWDVYFGVDDADGAVERAKQMGGSAMAGPIDVPGIGRMYMLIDPAGAGFYVLQAAPAEGA